MLVSCREVHQRVVDFSDKLVQLGLAHRHVGPAYRGAKWNAIFFYFTAGGGDYFRRWLDNRDASLEYAKRKLDDLSLLMRSPVPSFGEFDLAGISHETLRTYLETAERLDILTLNTEGGSDPAFFVYERKMYNRYVVSPVLDDLVNFLLDYDVN